MNHFCNLIFWQSVSTLWLFSEPLFKNFIGFNLWRRSIQKRNHLEAVSAGFYHSSGWGKNYTKIQIVTIEELLKGQSINMPPSSVTFKQAERSQSIQADQKSLFWMELSKRLVLLSQPPVFSTRPVGLGKTFISGISRKLSQKSF